ncbi:MAG: NADPH-dependent F420 reductase, partial [Anaerolineaceae bacterium]|nr:NADPH-dependent F420 reductase [Anaerolineaceae bacterium]
MVENNEIRTIAIVGGTGKEGKGLAYRWAKAGYRVLIGSRKQEKAEAAAEDVKSLLGDMPADVIGLANPDAAAAADIVAITVPYQAHRPTLESLKDILQGKILIDVTVPLVPPKVTKVQMPPAGSACQEAQEILGEDVKVVAAFQSVSFENLLEEGDGNCDILVTGNGRAARETVLKLVADAGMVGWDAGPIENSVVVEGFTS